MEDRGADAVGRVSRLAAVGVVAIAATLAVMLHLQQSLDVDSMYGRDETLHLTFAYRYDRIGLDPAGILRFNRSYGLTHYPPLPYVSSMPFLACPRLTPLAAVYASRAIWLLVLIGSLYGAGRRIGKSPWAGVAAVGLAGVSGAVVDTALSVSVEFPAMAAVALGVYGYTVSRDLRDLRGSVVFGVCAGIALLTKTIAFAFLVPLVAAGWLLPEKKDAGGQGVRTKNVAVAGLVAGLIAASFYLPLIDMLLRETGSEMGPGPSHVLRNLRGYGGIFWGGIVSPLQWALVAAALVAAAVKRDRWPVPLLAAGVFGFAFMLNAPNCAESYVYPHIALAAILVAGGFRYLSGRWRPLAALAILALYAWPFALPEAASHLRRPAKYEAALRVVYPYDRINGLVRVVPAVPYTWPWEETWRLSRVLATRYPGLDYGEMGVIDYEKNYGPIRPAIALAVTDRDRVMARGDEGFSIALRDRDQARRIARNIIAGKDLVVTVTSTPGSPISQRTEAPIADDVEALAKTHRLDLELTGVAFAGSTPRYAFWVRR